MKKIFLTIVILFNLSSFLFSSEKIYLNDYFEKASTIYNVPADLLKAVAYVESRYFQNIPTNLDSKEKPPSYGIMGLRNDEWFGNSLIEASKLINQPVEVLINNEYFNILGGSALLSKYANDLNINRSDINSWKQVLEKYSGIPQDNVKDFYSFDVFKILSQGNELDGIKILRNENTDMNIFPLYVKGENVPANIKSDDWGPALWDPSPNFTTNSITQLFAVVHMTEGSFASAVSWLKNPAANASSHYVVRSSDGYMVQLVREKDRAWHAVCWNSSMLGVEHEGFVSNPSWFTDAMYVASAALHRHFCQKFNIPFSHNRIIAHGEWQNPAWVSWMQTNYPGISPTCNTHTDPGVYWDWEFYMQLISQDTTKPNYTTYSPTANDTAWVNTSIKISFTQKMEKISTQTAFSINPNISGTFSWENSGKTMVFKPGSLLNTNTRYFVTLNNTAKNYINITIPNILNFDFLTKLNSTLQLLSISPSNSQSNITIQPEIKIKFDAPLNQTTITQNVILFDSGDVAIPITSILYLEENGQSNLSFSPLSKLKYFTDYKVIIKTGLKNVQGTGLNNEVVSNFKTQVNNFISGQVFESFEAISNWKDPNYSGSTVGTDPEKTTFTIVSEKKIDGANSGKIAYLFTGSNGVCRTFNAGKPSIGTDTTKKFGIWVYGDLSYNYLELWFYYNTSSNIILRLDTLNWAGWKFIEFPISRLGQNSDILFHSIVIVQNPYGSVNGQIYVDAAQTRSKIAVLPAPVNLIPYDGSSIYGSIITFRWSSVKNSTFYNLQFSADSNFSNIYLDKSAYNDSTLSLSFIPLFLFWRVRGMNQDVSGSWSIPNSFKTIELSVENEKNERNFSLEQNYPNPFNPNTKISYSSPVSCHISLIVYDILGKEVETLINEEQAPGKYSVEFNGTKYSSGIYYYELRAGEYRSIRKMLYMK